MYTVEGEHTETGEKLTLKIEGRADARHAHIGLIAAGYVVETVKVDTRPVKFSGVTEDASDEQE